MESETTTAASVPTPAATPSFAEQLREFARQHRDLARANYERFTKQYGSPAERVRAFRQRMVDAAARARSDAVAGYRKFEHDIEARIRAKPSTNGSGAHPSPPTP